MMNTSSQVVWNLLVLALLAAAVAFFFDTAPISESTRSASSVVLATTSVASAASLATSATATEAKSAPLKPVKTTSIAQLAPIATTTAVASSTTSAPPSTAVSRPANPYPFPPLSAEDINTDARAALVNILCLSGGSIHPISGSGVFIDTRGVILTNAHVGQYILLSENPLVNLSCLIRSGSPAKPLWAASVLYLPPVWVKAHVGELNAEHPTGTGEHDYALLLVDRALGGTALPAQFPATQFDTREGIGLTGDRALVAAYPAEFLGGFQAQNNLFAATSFTTIRQLYTFGDETIDVISVGGVIEAQSGSSGGAVVNAWDRLIGLVTTTSEGTTTAERNLHAITLSYINRDIKAQSGSSLTDILTGNLNAQQAQFNTGIFPDLIAQYLTRLQ